MRLLCLAEISNKSFWEDLPKRAQELNMERPLFYAMDALERIFDFPTPDQFKVAIADIAPGPATLIIMRRLIDRVLAPESVNQLKAPIATWLLFVRSHWLRMPPMMLFQHLFKKWRTNNA